jgi:hypothetical protein
MADTRRTRKPKKGPAQAAGRAKKPASEEASPQSRTYAVKIDYSMSVNQMIDAGRYDNDPHERRSGPRGFPAFSDMFHIEGTGIAETEVFLVDLGRTGRNARRMLQALGLEPARFEHLLALGAQHPDVHRHHKLAAVGSLWLDSEGRVARPGMQFAPILAYGQLVLCSWKDAWKDEDPDFRALAVRQARSG